MVKLSYYESTLNKSEKQKTLVYIGLYLLLFQTENGQKIVCCKISYKYHFIENFAAITQILNKKFSWISYFLNKTSEVIFTPENGIYHAKFNFYLFFI